MLSREKTWEQLERQLSYSYDQFRLTGADKNSGSAAYSYVYDRFGKPLAGRVART